MSVSCSFKQRSFIRLQRNMDGKCLPHRSALTFHSGLAASKNVVHNFYHNEAYLVDGDPLICSNCCVSSFHSLLLFMLTLPTLNFLGLGKKMFDVYSRNCTTHVNGCVWYCISPPQLKRMGKSCNTRHSPRTEVVQKLKEAPRRYAQLSVQI